MSRSLNMHVVMPGSTGLSGEAAAAYFRLCWALWEHKGWLPDEPGALARFAGVAAAAWARVWEAIADRFEVCAGQVIHRAVSEAWADEEIRKERADRASAAGVAARIQKRKAAQLAQRTVQGEVLSLPTRTVNQPSTDGQRMVDGPSTDRSPICARQSPDLNSDPSLREGCLSLSGSPSSLMRSGSGSDAGARGKADAIRAVFDHYRSLHPRAFPAPKSTSREWSKIAARLAEGYSADDLCKAIDGYHVSPFHCGDNPDGTKYQGLDLIVRDAAHVVRGIEFATAPLEPVLTPKERRSVRAVRNIVERHGGAALPENSPWKLATASGFPSR